MIRRASRSGSEHDPAPLRVSSCGSLRSPEETPLERSRFGDEGIDYGC